MNNSPVVVGIAQGEVVRQPSELITYALGSCVGVCLYDKKHHIAGLAHILLPIRSEALDQKNPYKFADSGCRLLRQRMILMGAEADQITAKIAGGARMFATDSKTESIGERNIKAVREALHRCGIQILAEDVGKDYGRTITFKSSSGSLHVKSIKYGIKII